jgi:DNA gyrase subunit A
MSIERPDLSGVDPQILAYIESLEAELTQFREGSRSHGRLTATEPAEPSEPPTTICLVTMSKSGAIKRTYRHFYTRQRRGGMGIFDLDTPEDDPPTFMTLADEDADLLFITDFGRGYRLPVTALPASQIRERGQDLSILLNMQPDESVRVVLPAKDEGYVAVLSERGYVRLLRHNYLGKKMRPGTPLFDAGRFGPVAAGSWTTGEDELFIVTKSGKGIRFREKMVHANGSLGIRLERGDDVVAVAGVTEESGVLMIGADGKGTIRLMEGFAENKAPGSGGKTAMKTDHLIGAMTVKDSDDIFVISRLSKVIRFQAVEIPPKTGVVQGVNCMALRADEVTALTVCDLSRGGSPI